MRSILLICFFLSSIIIVKCATTYFTTISTIAGTGTGTYTGDNGQATSATIKEPHGLAIDSSGNVYIGDGGNYRVRKYTASTGIITNFAGTGVSTFNGDGGVASSARISYPHQLALDSSGISTYIQQPTRIRLTHSSY